MDIDQILAGLGGQANIVSIESCITRLRAEVHEAAKVDLQRLKDCGCYGISAVGSSVQVIVGPHADLLVSELEERTWSADQN